MRTLTYQKPIRPLPLLEALQAAGVPVQAVHPDGRVEVADEAVTATVDAVVAAHDATTIDAGEVQKANLLKDAKATLRAYYAQSNATITNAQSIAAIKALIVAVRALAQIDN